MIPKVYVNQLQIWVRTREERGESVQSYEVWAYIKSHWPHLEEYERDQIFRQIPRNR